MKELPQFTVEEMTDETAELATAVRLRSWLDTYVNEEVGVTRGWIEARNKEQLSPERVARRRAQRGTADGTYWVAKEEAGSVIGVATAYRDDGGVQHLGSLYVDKHWHGKGVGGALMQKVLVWAESAKPIELGVVSYNERAKAFYRKWGFVEIPGSETLFDDKIPEVKMIRKGDKE